MIDNLKIGDIVTVHWGGWDGEKAVVTDINVAEDIAYITFTDMHRTWIQMSSNIIRRVSDD